MREAEGNVPKWLILTGLQTADIDGIDMGTGAQHVHFGPTNKENAAGPPKMEYLTPNCFVDEEGSRIVRPSFQHKPKQKKGDGGATSTASAPTAQEQTPPDATPPDTTTPTPATPPNPKGGPSRVAYSAMGALRKARPKDFFDLQLRPKFVKEYMVDTTNKRAASEGAGPGGTKYRDYAPFDVQEMYKFIGLFIVNALIPRTTSPSMVLVTIHSQ